MAFSNGLFCCVWPDYPRKHEKNHKKPQPYCFPQFVVEFRGISGEFQGITRRINAGPRGRRDGKIREV
jgi:hypothetical protein